MTPLDFALAASACLPGTMVLTARPAPRGNPPPLAQSFRTHDPDDLIALVSTPEANGLGMVRLELIAGRAWRALGVGEALLATDGGRISLCLPPQILAVAFWKRTPLPMCVGTAEIDLTAYAGHCVRFDWIRG